MSVTGSFDLLEIKIDLNAYRRFWIFLISSFTLLFANLTWGFNVVKRLNYFFIISPGAVEETAMNSFIPRFKLQILKSFHNQRARWHFHADILFTHYLMKSLTYKRANETKASSQPLSSMTPNTALTNRNRWTNKSVRSHQGNARRFNSEFGYFLLITLSSEYLMKNKRDWIQYQRTKRQTWNTWG